MKFKYKEETPLEKRLVEGEGMRRKYPDRSPAILERVPKSALQDLEKKKFLLPNDLTMGQLYFLMRKRLGIVSDQAIFLFVNNTIPPKSATLGSLYKDFRDEDGFLYIGYADENVFVRR